MHFDRQLLYLACLFGITNVSGLAIPEQSRPLQSLPSSDSSRTAYHATNAQESATAIPDSAVPTKSRSGLIFPTADPRIIDSASRATLPSFSYDTAPDLISTSRSSDLSSTHSVSATSLASSATFPPMRLDEWIDFGHQNELRQVSISSSSASSGAIMSSSAASGAVASGVVVPGSPCSVSSSVLLCSSDGMQFGFCVDGHMVWRPVAPGTTCSDGEIQFGVSSSSSVSAGATASGSSISVATVSSSSLSSTAPTQSGSSSQSSASQSTKSQSGTAVVPVSTKSKTDTTTKDTTSQTTSLTSTDKTATNTGITTTGKQTSSTETRSSDTATHTDRSSTETSPTNTRNTPTETRTSLSGTMTSPGHPVPTTGKMTNTHSMPTTFTHSPTTSMSSTMSTATLAPTGANATTPGSDPSHPLTNASVAGIASGLTAGAVMVALGGLYAWRRRKQGKPLFGARGSKRSTGSFYPKSAWLYDPPVSPGHSRAGSEAGQNLIPAPRPETSEMEAGMASPELRPAGAASPDLREGRASSPLLPPPITITRSESPDGYPDESPRRSGGRRSRPMMSINEEEE